MASAWSETPGSETKLSQDNNSDFLIGGSADAEHGKETNRTARADFNRGTASAVDETRGIDGIEKDKTTVATTADLVRLREKKTDNNYEDAEVSGMRPRSFSDASFSKAGKIRHKKLDTKEAVLKWRRERGIKFEKRAEDDSNRQTSRAPETKTEFVSGSINDKDFERKQAVKVIICRESKVMNEPEKGRKTRQDQNQDLKSTKKSGHLLSRSKSAHGRTNYSSLSEDEDDIPPPKPALPEKYRTSYFMQQIQSLKPDKPPADIEKRLDELEKHLFRSDLLNVEKDLSATDNKRNDVAVQKTSDNIQKVDGKWTQTKRNSGQFVLSNTHKSVGEVDTDKDTKEGVSDKKFDVSSGRGRKPFRSDSKIALFRSYDSKLRAIALKRELDTLRSSEHVRQRLSSSEQTDVIDLQKELDDINKYKFETKLAGPAASDTSDSGSLSSSSVRSKTTGARNIAQNTVSFKPNVYHDSIGAKTLLTESKVDKHGRRAFPPSGTLKGVNSYSDGYESLNNRSEGLSKASNAVGEQGRDSLQRKNSRSKSESSLVRKTLDSGAIPKTVKNEVAHNQTKDGLNASRGLNLSKSVSNINRGRENASLSRSITHLKRKQDTIRKFNYDTLAQAREKIRISYERKPDRQDSESPLYTPSGQDVDDDQHLFPEASDSGASVGDNRSDEEKYAALSRSKILHSKSSSLDSHLKSNTNHRLHQKVVRPSVKLASSASLTDYRSSPIDTTLLLDSSSSSCDSFDVYLTENKGIKHEKFNTDIPPIPKKTLKPKSVGIQSWDQDGEKTMQQKVVLRQCRIGSDVAFSLVGLNQSQANKVGC